MKNNSNLPASYYKRTPRGKYAVSVWGRELFFKELKEAIEFAEDMLTGKGYKIFETGNDEYTISGERKEVFEKKGEE